MARSLAESLHGGYSDVKEVKRVSETLTFERARLWPKFSKFASLLVSLQASNIRASGVLSLK